MAFGPRVGSTPTFGTRRPAARSRASQQPMRSRHGRQGVALRDSAQRRRKIRFRLAPRICDTPRRVADTRGRRVGPGYGYRTEEGMCEEARATAIFRVLACSRWRSSPPAAAAGLTTAAPRTRRGGGGGAGRHAQIVVRPAAAGLETASRRPRWCERSSSSSKQANYKAGDYTWDSSPATTRPPQAGKWDAAQVRGERPHLRRQKSSGHRHLQLRVRRDRDPGPQRAADRRWSAREHRRGPDAHRRRAPRPASRTSTTRPANELHARRRGRRLPGHDRRPVHEELGREEGLHPRRQGALREGHRRRVRNAAKKLGITVAGHEAWDPSARTTAP